MQLLLLLPTPSFLKISSFLHPRNINSNHDTKAFPLRKFDPSVKFQSVSSLQNVRFDTSNVLVTKAQIDISSCGVITEEDEDNVAPVRSQKTSVIEEDDQEEVFVRGEPKTIREICKDMLPELFLQRAEQLGFVYSTDAQAEALPVLLSGKDCLLHSQTGSGKTLCYLLAIFAKLNPTRAAVQALVVVPTRELGMQVVKEARKLGKILDMQNIDKPGGGRSFDVMALLDGGSLTRQKIWLKADPPGVVIGTIACVCKMIELKKLKVNAVNTIVIDEVDAMFGQTQHIALLRKLLTSCTLAQNRQTIFASATIPQHNQFIQKCISEKWVKENFIHVQVNHTNKMPWNLIHRHVICERDEKLKILNTMLQADKPNAAIIFVNEQSWKSKRKGTVPSTILIAEMLLSTRLDDGDFSPCKPLVLDEDSNVNARSSILDEFPSENHILIATDLASRGLDIPEVSHVYNFDIPPAATTYIHRGGRTARKPLDSSYDSLVTTFLTKEELFVYQRYQNEINFPSTQVDIDKLMQTGS